jgi:predicted RNA binding protein YcfA (HicA-like mRNA interferase family)
VHDERRTLVTVPYHEKLAPGTLNSIIKQSKMERDEFLTYLE